MGRTDTAPTGVRQQGDPVMIKGILLGSASALALSALVLSAVSLVLPAPEGEGRFAASVPSVPVQRDTAERLPRVPEPPAAPGDRAEPVRSAEVSRVDIPATSEFNRPPEDGTAVTPGAEVTQRPVAVAERLTGGAAPRDGIPADTRSATRPEPSVIAGFGAGPEAGDAPRVPRAPSEVAPQTFGVAVPGDEDRAGPGTTPPPAVPDRGAQTEADTSGATESFVVPVTRPDGEAGATAERAGRVPSDGGDAARNGVDAPGDAAARAARTITLVGEPVVVPRVEPPEVTAEPVLPRRLILDSAREDAVARDPAPETDALSAFAADFANPEGLPLMAVVLIDDPSFDVDRRDLTGLDFPVTFAIDPTRGDAGTVAATYRAAGHEVVALADIFPAGAAAQDIEVTMAALHRSLPQAVGLLDRATGGIAGDRDGLRALLPALREAGMGLLAYPDGLDSGVAEARRAGVPATTLYRVLDDAGQRAPVISRFLDRATFEAAQDGAAVVLGRANVETVTALRTWRLGDRSRRVAAAPLSAVLRAVPDE